MNTKIKYLLISCAISGILAVIFGAFGAHYLKEHLSSIQIGSYGTASQYHFIHTLAMLGTIILYRLDPSIYLYRAAFCFFLGILLFSGSIYLLSTKDLLGIQNTGILGLITPIGGLVFIFAWCNILIYAIYKTKE